MLISVPEGNKNMLTKPRPPDCEVLKMLTVPKAPASLPDVPLRRGYESVYRIKRSDAFTAAGTTDNHF